MEKQLSALGYWLGLICTVLALILRRFASKVVQPQRPTRARNGHPEVDCAHGYQEN
jgi:hypothetical protein